MSFAQPTPQINEWYKFKRKKNTVKFMKIKCVTTVGGQAYFVL